MSDPFSDERESLTVGLNRVIVANGDSVPLTRNNMVLTVQDGATSTSITTTPASACPRGLQVTFDNTGGSGSLSVNSGEVVVLSGNVYSTTVCSDGSGGQQFVINSPSADVEELTYGLASETLIQNALDSATEDRKTVFIGSGDISVTETISTPYELGGQIRGNGRGEMIGPSHNLRGPVTNLVWAGATTEDTTATTYWSYNSTLEDGTRPLNALLWYRASEFSVQDLMIAGGTRAEIDAAKAKPHVAILVHQDQGGIGTGGLTLDRVAIQHWKIGIQTAVEWDENNCDTSVVSKGYWYNLDTGFLSKNLQGLGWTFRDLIVREVSTAFLYEGGGDFLCERLLVLGPTPSTLLMFDPVNIGSIGHNGAVYVFNTIELDASAGNTVLLNYDSGNASLSTLKAADIRFNDVRFQYTGYTTPAFYAPPDTRLTVRDSRKLQAGMFAWGDGATIFLDNCMGWQHPSGPSDQDVDALEDLFNTSTTYSDGTCTVICQNNYQYSDGAPYPEFTSTSTYTRTFTAA